MSNCDSTVTIILCLIVIGIILYVCLGCRIQCKNDVDSFKKSESGCYESSSRTCKPGYGKVDIMSSKTLCCPLDDFAYIPPCYSKREGQCQPGYKEKSSLGTFGRNLECCPKFSECEKTTAMKCPPGKQFVGRTYGGPATCCKINKY